MASVLVIGSGGREHALAWALSRSPKVDRVYVAPGNGGTERPAGTGLQNHAPMTNAALQPDNFTALIDFAHANKVDLAVVGPEDPLAKGIVDAFQNAGLAIFGPVRGAAQIEASKIFCKDLMTEQGIPTGEYQVFDDVMEARAYLDEYRKAVVIKADGLAAGKGVIVTRTREEAGMAIHRMLVDREFGEAGSRILIEERLTGQEISVLAFTDGKTVKPMILARDYKPALDGNRGPNTGGMGAIAPAHDISAAQIEEITTTVLQPMVDGLRALGTPYVGVLYAGLMLTARGIRTLEFNCRFGDPETQAILPLLRTDLYDIMHACINGTLHEIEIAWHDAACATVILASPGYPDDYPKGLPVTGLETLEGHEDLLVFHAGTARQQDTLVTNGGRVMAVTALDPSLDTALERAYAGVARIHFDGMQYRRDIGTIYAGPEG